MNRSLPLLFILSITSFLALFYFSFLPSYTRLAIGFLIPFLTFFIFRKEEKLDHKKFLTIILLTIPAAIVWDNIAINFNIWGFPTSSVSFWILGVPLEEYIWGIWFSTVILGVYTSLPHFRHHPISKALEIRDTPLLVLILILQSIVWSLIFFAGSESYLKWLSILAIIPSIAFLWRKGERIDEIRLIITCVVMVFLVILIDLIFIKANAWYYNEDALLGRIGIVPIDDFLFGIFNSIVIIGIYTSLPSKHLLSGKW